MQLKRALPFLLLNIIVSAAVTLLVLALWGGGLRSPFAAPALPTANAAAVFNPTQAPRPTTPPTPPVEAKLLVIQEVIGAGDLNNEVVQILRLGDADLALTGWKMEDNAGHHFTFPELTLSKGGAVRIYTRTGTNTAIELFWNQGEAVWTPGKVVAIYDPQGNLRATYTVR